MKDAAVTPVALAQHRAERATPHDALVADHAQLDQMIRRLLVRAHGGDAADVFRAWEDLERAVREHMEAEERYLLPRFERAAPNEAAWVREDHERIRALLDEIGYGLELHAVREDTLRALAERIRTHAAREESLLYRWADRSVEPALFSKLRRALSRGIEARV